MKFLSKVKFPDLKRFGNVIMFPKKPKGFQIATVGDKSCNNCAHHRKEGDPSYHVCMHYPKADIHEITTKRCYPDNNRELWSLKKGLLTRFFTWLF